MQNSTNEPRPELPPEHLLAPVPAAATDTQPLTLPSMTTNRPSGPSETLTVPAPSRGRDESRTRRVLREAATAVVRLAANKVLQYLMDRITAAWW